MLARFLLDGGTGFDSRLEGALLERPHRSRCAESRLLWPLRYARQRVGASRRGSGGDVRHVDRDACVAAAIDCGAADGGHAPRGARGATRRLCGRLFTLSRTTAGRHFAPHRGADARTERTGQDGLRSGLPGGAHLHSTGPTVRPGLRSHQRAPVQGLAPRSATPRHRPARGRARAAGRGRTCARRRPRRGRSRTRCRAC